MRIRTALIVCLIVLFVTLSGTVVAYAFVPTEVDAEVPVLNYTHNGNLDYLVEMQPSTLFDTPPQPAPPNPKYPAQIVDSLDLVFTYAPSEPVSSTARVDAVLENPGIWRKEIGLVTEQALSGGFNIAFSLDIEALTQLFNTIETETLLHTTTRYLTVRAEVSNDKEQFSQDLPIKLTDTVIEVDSGLRQNRKLGVSYFDYTVNLKPNSIFDTATLGPPSVSTEVASPTIVGPGPAVLLKLAERIDFAYRYRLTSKQVVTNTVSGVEIAAFFKAVGLGGAQLWSKQVPLVTSETKDDGTVSFSIELPEQLAMLDAIRAETGVAANKLTIVCKVHTIASTAFGQIDDSFTQTISGTISGSVLEWDDEMTKQQPGTITETRAVPNPVKIANRITLADTRAILLWLSSCLAAGSILLGYVTIKYRPAIVASMGEREARQARKRLKDFLVEVSVLPDFSKSTVIPMPSLREISKAADDLLKPILHFKGAGRHVYLVFDNDVVYLYTAPGSTKETQHPPDVTLDAS